MSIWMMTEAKSPQLYKLLQAGARRRASDLHLANAIAPIYRIDGELCFAASPPLTPAILQEYFMAIASEKQQAQLQEEGEVDFAFAIGDDGGRCRVNAYKASGNIAMALRFIPHAIPPLESLNFPPVMKELTRYKNGLIIISGATGSGKSTTVAAMLEWINQSRSSHILTLEDPIEFFYKSQRSLISQREISHDSKSFASALRAALREDPDILMIGEMRDSETAAAVLTAAETGHLVFASLHTSDAVQTVDRLIDMFPPHQQGQIRYQLATSLRAVIAQKLLPLADKQGRIAALEILLATPAVANMIRNAKTHQLLTIMQTGSELGMQTMEMAIAKLVRNGLIAASAVLDL